MRPRLAVIFVAIVILPLGVMAWLGVRLAQTDRERAEKRLTDVVTEQLRTVDGALAQVLAEERQGIERAMEGVELTPDAMRAARARSPLVRQPFVLNGRTGQLAYPSLTEDLDTQEGEFLRRTRDIWMDRALLPYEGTGSAAWEQSGKTKAASGSKGWYAWRWGSALHVLCFWKDARGPVIGAEIDRARQLSDLIDRLPDTEPGAASGLTRLVDDDGSVLYQWGAYVPPAGEPPRARLSLSRPLSAFALEAFVPASPGEAGAWAGSFPWLSLFAIVVIALAAHFFRESAREAREAARRVSFVNQVSHELKTPLTNIRLYAELLERDLPEEDAGRAHLDVIVAESQRLSRLIKNILTFGKSQRHELSIAKKPGVVDDTVASVAQAFQPALAAAGIETRVDLGAPDVAAFDPDALEQILGNLLGNVEKYAPGRPVRIATRQDGEKITIAVKDHGPGIPDAEAQRVFEPFYRIRSDLSEGVTGTGIGLPIARELARLHGGDLALEHGGPGATFVVTLPRKESA